MSLSTICNDHQRLNCPLCWTSPKIQYAPTQLIQTADALAKAVRSLTTRLREDYKGVLPGEIDDAEESLAAYEIVRSQTHEDRGSK